ncbi:hypothetical protein [Kistimonas asteriae]|uniref:hypothetical protein n=1 Tax=Kistimonas asteriae TaxID=517724 RepID=UPI001BAAC0A7|nr:hypothetical protein [Kistimonas asteriae]
MARYGSNHKGGRPAKPSKQIKVRESVIDEVLSYRDALYAARDFVDDDDDLRDVDLRCVVHRAMERVEDSVNELLRDLHKVQRLRAPKL